MITFLMCVSALRGNLVLLPAANSDKIEKCRSEHYDKKIPNL